MLLAAFRCDRPTRSMVPRVTLKLVRTSGLTKTAKTLRCLSGTLVFRCQSPTLLLKDKIILEAREAAAQSKSQVSETTGASTLALSTHTSHRSMLAHFGFGRGRCCSHELARQLE